MKLPQVNKVYVTGVVSNVELKVSKSSGTAIALVMLDSSYSTRSGDVVTTPVLCVAYGKLAEMCVMRLCKGTSIHAEGRLSMVVSPTTRKKEIDYTMCVSLNVVQFLDKYKMDNRSQFEDFFKAAPVVLDEMFPLS